MVAESTDQLYRTHARRFERWLKDHKRRADPEGYCAALDALTKSVSRKTWRLYRNALTYRIRISKGPELAAQFMALTDQLEKPPTRRRKLLRHVPTDVAKAILEALRRARAKTAHAVADLMMSIIATGIRPAEWPSVEVPRVGVLRVRNAKFKPASGSVPGRGNGQYRELQIEVEFIGTVIEEAILRTIARYRGRKWSSVAPNVNRTFKGTLRGLIRREALTRRWEKLRLYDCRHQFSCDAKATLSLLGGEVAAAMGHGSALTAVEHYGRRGKAGGRSAVRPSAASVAAVDPASIVRLRLELGVGTEGSPTPAPA